MEPTQLEILADNIGNKYTEVCKCIKEIIELLEKMDKNIFDILC